MSNRKNAEQYILTWIEKLASGGDNAKIYKDLFASMSDEDFDGFMMAIKSGKNRLAVIVPNFGTAKITTANNLKLGEELGHQFFQRIWIEGDGVNPSYLTPVKYLVVDLPLRRQAQILVKKISIPEDNASVDDFTGQPTGKSKGSKISYDETQVMAAMGLDRTLIEFIKFRGGDSKGFQAMNSSISRLGNVSLDSIKHYAGGVESTNTLSAYLTAMHYSNTL